MHRNLIIPFFLINGFATFAQNNIGIGTPSPNASAILDISSTTRGLLAPRMTTAQRTAIASPAKGLLVYDTDLNGLFHYNGSAWATVGGGGGFTLPYTGSIASASPALSITNTGDGKAITGISNSSFTAAIEGTANGTGGFGVVGNAASVSGYGIYGTNPTGTAVYGFSVNGGVALRGNSPLGYALLTNGNLRLTGGNTNPTAGAVLTSIDGNGNAVWKDQRIAFVANNAVNQFITSGVSRKIEFDAVSVNYGAGFSVFTGTVSAGSSVFTAPVAGLYSFSSAMRVRLPSAVTNFNSCQIQIVVNGTVIAESGNTFRNTSVSSLAHAHIDQVVPLKAGDKVWIAIIQFNDGNLSAEVYQFAESAQSWFSGHLVFAD